MKWYQKSWAAILFLFLFFPVGLFFVWKYQPWKKGVKIAITAVVALFVVVVAIQGGESPAAPASADSTTATATSIPTATTQSTTTSDSTTTTKPTTTSKPIATTKDTSRTVYITPSGERYHYDPECGGKNSSPISLNKALARGRTPCQKCVHD